MSTYDRVMEFIIPKIIEAKARLHTNRKREDINIAAIVQTDAELAAMRREQYETRNIQH